MNDKFREDQDHNLEAGHFAQTAPSPRRMAIYSAKQIAQCAGLPQTLLRRGKQPRPRFGFQECSSKHLQIWVSRRAARTASENKRVASRVWRRRPPRLGARAVRRDARVYLLACRKRDHR